MAAPSSQPIPFPDPGNEDWVGPRLQKVRDVSAEHKQRADTAFHSKRK